MKAQRILPKCILFFSPALLMAAVVSGACAQNLSPLSDKLLPEPAVVNTAAVSVSAAPVAKAATPAPARPAESSATEASQEGVRVGDVTHTLLQAQVDGRVAGPRLPMLGATADASWQRYLDSFKHPLPESFETKLNKK